MKTASIDRTKNWTVDDYLLLGEMSTFCELINGELIMSPSPAPYHQLVVGNLYDILKAYSRKRNDLIFFAPVDLYIDRKNVFQLDLIYVAEANKKIITERGIEGVPDLVVEVISPSNIFSDRNRKKKTYQDIGVGEYWIIDPANKTFEIYHKDQTDKDSPILYLAEEGIVSSAILKDLSFDLKEIF
ncbi:MAG: Uma2 family endonuclease [Cyclobacteriaceae bacterium]|nr:Uma2 family endonuclease [Cyclobacteriaceae bacterium]